MYTYINLRSGQKLLKKFKKICKGCCIIQFVYLLPVSKNVIIAYWVKNNNKLRIGKIMNITVKKTRIIELKNR